MGGGSFYAIANNFWEPVFGLLSRRRSEFPPGELVTHQLFQGVINMFKSPARANAMLFCYFPPTSLPTPSVYNAPPVVACNRYWLCRCWTRIPHYRAASWFPCCGGKVIRVTATWPRGWWFPPAASCSAVILRRAPHARGKGSVAAQQRARPRAAGGLSPRSRGLVPAQQGKRFSSRGR
jgi:hypothetical protein